MNLFDSGKIEFPPVTDLVEILLKARDELKKSEDDWTLDDMCKVRDMFPVGFRNIDPSIIGVRMRRLRKDKHVPKIKEPMSFVDKLRKMIRDFKKNRDRRGDSHQSTEYMNYIISDEWIAKASEHKNRVNHRCQFCDCPSSKLQVHHTSEGYRNLKKEMPWHLIAVCKDPCHLLADMLRSGLLRITEDFESNGFFSGDIEQ